MENYLATKKNKIMSITEKNREYHVEQDKPRSKSNFTYFCLSVESRPKMMVIIIIMDMMTKGGLKENI
jgi:hypothetical protein